MENLIAKLLDDFDCGRMTRSFTGNRKCSVAEAGSNNRDRSQYSSGHVILPRQRNSSTVSHRLAQDKRFGVARLRPAHTDAKSSRC